MLSSLQDLQKQVNEQCKQMEPAVRAIFTIAEYKGVDICSAEIPGTEIGETGEDGARFLDNKRIEGTIATMVEEAVAFTLRNMKTRTIIDPETGKRKDRREYPVNAIREAILNAVIHRDYSFRTERTPVQLLMFSDRIEIHSPGNLYGRMTVEQLGISKPDMRNAALSLMTEFQTEAENRYSGVPTMRREMAAYRLPPPVFENRRNEFVVTLYNHTADSVLSGQNLKAVISSLWRFKRSHKNS